MNFALQLHIFYKNIIKFDIVNKKTVRHHEFICNLFLLQTVGDPGFYGLRER